MEIPPPAAQQAAQVQQHPAGRNPRQLHFEGGHHGLVPSAGLPWLRFIRQRCPQVHFWPFDGLEVPSGKSLVAEIYPALWMRQFAREGRNEDQQAAYAVVEWLRQTDLADTLPAYLNPKLENAQREQALIEGWILGVA